MRGLSLSYGRVRGLDDISLEVSPGEIVGLLGHSGCGKSTLLRLIAGLQAPDSGTITVAGRPFTGPSIFVEPDERGIGLMVQDYALFPHLSVIDNVAFGLLRRGGEEARRVGMEMLDHVGLAHMAKRYPHTLSGGEQQRVALARALAPEPRLLLLDEPFSNLDRRTAARVRRETLAILRTVGATVILVTHDPEEAMEVADRIVLMEGGRVVQSGTPEELYGDPTSLFAARFFGELNEWEGICRDGAVATPFGRFAIPGLKNDAAIRLCFRTGSVRIGEGDIRARLVGQLFLGDRRRLAIEIEGGAILDASTAAAFTAPLGSEMMIAIDPRAIMLFAGTDGLRHRAVAAL